MKKVSIVGVVGIPACYGGFESLVENLTKYSSGEIKYHIYCSSNAYENKLKSHNNAQLSYLPLKANGIQSIPYDVVSLFLNIFKKPDVTVILGVSGCVFLPIYRLFSKSKIVTNIDGLEWKRDKWGKFAKLFLKFSESLAVKFSDVIVTDNKAIGDYVISEYAKENVVIAYGGDHVISKKKDKISKKDYFLSLCRIEPENNVELILESFSNNSQKIKFIGNWMGSDYGRRLKHKFQTFENIEMIDPIYDLEKLYSLRAGCKGYIHGHSAGGTNPSLVEAMHFNIPVYAFNCDFNRYTTEDKAFYFSTSNDLRNLITKENSEESINDNAKNMKEIANKRYTWEIVTAQYEENY
ncbi:DUF1972 domain-containing protein [Vibrio vulnificus]|uniref:DUF1972 domain-containing protein n=1 Tax=Vibrio vulnificus TaxID=672 RepID=UPI001FACBBD4|nr:DUF1972 domain-containing protein [Vibrio vulnificus]MCJ0821969.1 DUF1972 domain-containing protein [Vibrio vulnificus]